MGQTRVGAKPPVQSATLPRVGAGEKPQRLFMEDSTEDATDVPPHARVPAGAFAEFVLPALDGFPLVARRYEPAGPARGTLIVHGATAAPQKIYRPFATFLAEAGVRVVTYDYRGVGRSRPASLRGFDATMTQWGKLDARAVHRHVREHHGEGAVALLGHSFGGQLVGLIDEAREVSGALFVGAQFGYYRHWALLQQPRLALLWRGLVPLLSATFGYLPARAGLGEDLPAGVAREWARWCTHPDYLIGGHPDAVARFARFDRPSVFYSFTDDDFAPSGAVRALLARLSSARVEHRRVDPVDLGTGPIGHFGFFRPKCREPLWTEALTFFLDAFEGRAPRRVRRPASSASTAGLDGWDVRDEDILADLAGR